MLNNLMDLKYQLDKMEEFLILTYKAILNNLIISNSTFLKTTDFTKQD